MNLKHLKRSSIAAAILFVGIISCTLLGCSSTENESDSPSNEPKLKSLVTSKEYERLNLSFVSFGRELKSAYSKLSNDKKEKVISILNEIKTKEKTQKETTELLGELSSIIKIDFNAASDRINEEASNMKAYNEVNNITKKEFSLAINKYPNEGIPRLRSSSEVSTADCITACAAIATACVAFGVTAPLCVAAFAACCLTC